MPRRGVWQQLVRSFPAQGLPSEDDMLLLQPYLNRTALGDGIDAYRMGDFVLVPLGEICRLLGFAIPLNAARTSASGHFIDPKRTFSLDLDTRMVSEVAGRRVPLPKSARMPRDIYVDARSLQAWFPLEVELLPKDSALVLTAKEKLADPGDLGKGQKVWPSLHAPLPGGGDRHDRGAARRALRIHGPAHG